VFDAVYAARLPLPPDGALPPPNAAVRFLARKLEEQPVAIAAIGPLTNLGLLAHHHPDLLARASAIVIVAGRSAGRRFYLGEQGPVRDFTFESDVRAMQLLRDVNVPLVLAGFELTSQVAVTEADLAAIAARGTAAARHLHENSIAWVRHWTRSFPADAGFHPWDSAAISWLRHPEYFTAEPRGTRIVEASLSEREREHNPDASSQEGFWLECDAGFSGPRVTYLTGFAPGGKAAFVRDIVENVY
jgi:inosine-uridine nucleoside N-ribohydrolase